MSPRPDEGVLRALAALNRALAALKAPAMIIGGIAVIARGVPRLTVDVDATVWGGEIALPGLFATLEAHGIVPRIPDAEELARSRFGCLLLLLFGCDLIRRARQSAEALPRETAARRTW